MHHSITTHRLILCPDLRDPDKSGNDSIDRYSFVMLERSISGRSRKIYKIFMAGTLNDRSQDSVTEHHRHSIRLKDYDYRQAGAYFVTVCVQGKERLFGEIVDGTMKLTRLVAYNTYSLYWWHGRPCLCDSENCSVTRYKVRLSGNVGIDCRAIAPIFIKTLKSDIYPDCQPVP